MWYWLGELGGGDCEFCGTADWAVLLSAGAENTYVKNYIKLNKYAIKHTISTSIGVLIIPHAQRLIGVTLRESKRWHVEVWVKVRVSLKNMKDKNTRTREEK